MFSLLDDCLFEHICSILLVLSPTSAPHSLNRITIFISINAALKRKIKAKPQFIHYWEWIWKQCTLPLDCCASDSALIAVNSYRIFMPKRTTSQFHSSSNNKICQIPIFLLSYLYFMCRRSSSTPILLLLLAGFYARPSKIFFHIEKTVREIKNGMGVNIPRLRGKRNDSVERHAPNIFMASIWHISTNDVLPIPFKVHKVGKYELSDACWMLVFLPWDIDHRHGNLHFIFSLQTL